MAQTHQAASGKRQHGSQYAIRWGLGYPRWVLFGNRVLPPACGSLGVSIRDVEPSDYTCWVETIDYFIATADVG